MLDFFFYPHSQEDAKVFSIPHSQAQHFKALRKKTQDKLILTNGQGLVSKAEILNINHKEIRLEILAQEQRINPHRHILAIAKLKTQDRLEWLVEKLVEIGIRAIVILQTQNTSPGSLRADRLKKIMLAAMLQSQQAHLPELQYNLSLEQLFNNYPDIPKYLAHCNPNFPRPRLTQMPKQALFMIGPEGDFSTDEIQFALNYSSPISLSTQRLRSETAALVAISKASL